MGLTRREFLKGAILTGIGALIGASAIEDLELDKIIGGNKTTTVTEIPPETVVITVVNSGNNSQTPQTYTETETQTVTEYSNTTVTETVTPTETQTSTQTSSTTTQPPQNLEQILFGNSNMPFIPLEVTNVQIGSSNAHMTVYDYVTDTQLTVELPIKYVSNGNINIGNLLSAVNSYNQNNGTNYKVYLVLGSAGLNQAIQQNDQWILPATEIYYNIIISDRDWNDVYNALQNLLNGNATVVMPTSNQGPYSNSLWGWSNVNDESIIIEYQNGQQVNSVTNYINLADYILGTPNNSNPTSGGILHVDTIASTQESSVYQNQYPLYNVNSYFGTLIVLKQSQGYEFISNL
jgi:hypothetical protein